MGTIYQSFEEMESTFPFVYSGKPEGIRLFIRGNDPEKRQKACVAVKGLLEEMLGSAKTSGEITEFEVRVIDLLTGNNSEFTDYYGSFWNRMGNKNGAVFIPIFHNSGTHPNLPQIAFDRKVPGIFSLANEEYLSVTNRSKRDCYDILESD